MKNSGTANASLCNYSHFYKFAPMWKFSPLKWAGKDNPLIQQHWKVNIFFPSLASSKLHFISILMRFLWVRRDEVEPQELSGPRKIADIGLNSMNREEFSKLIKFKKIMIFFVCWIKNAKMQWKVNLMLKLFSLNLFCIDNK